jgi:hypothetical protein
MSMGTLEVELMYRPSLGFGHACCVNDTIRWKWFAYLRIGTLFPYGFATIKIANGMGLKTTPTTVRPNIIIVTPIGRTLVSGIGIGTTLQSIMTHT